MRGRAEVVAVHLTPGQVLVTWPRAKAEVEAAFQEELCESLPQVQLLWDLCGQELGGDIFFLQVGPFSVLPSKSLNTQALPPEASVPTMGGTLGMEASKDIRAG